MKFDVLSLRTRNAHWTRKATWNDRRNNIEKDFTVQSRRNKRRWRLETIEKRRWRSENMQPCLHQEVVKRKRVGWGVGVVHKDYPEQNPTQARQCTYWKFPIGFKFQFLPQYFCVDALQSKDQKGKRACWSTATHT